MSWRYIVGRMREEIKSRRGSSSIDYKGPKCQCKGSDLVNTFILCLTICEAM
jgi:hypothetical protein